MVRGIILENMRLAEEYAAREAMAKGRDLAGKKGRRRERKKERHQQSEETYAESKGLSGAEAGPWPAHVAGCAAPPAGQSAEACFLLVLDVNWEDVLGEQSQFAQVSWRRGLGIRSAPKEWRCVGSLVHRYVPDDRLVRADD